MLQLNAPAEGYTVSKDGKEPNFLHGSVFDWLGETGVQWIFSTPASNIDFIKDESFERALDLQFIAATLRAEEYQNVKMSMEVSDPFSFI